MSLERVVGWWTRGPVAKLIKASWDVGGLANYQNLVSKRFGEGITSQTLIPKKRC